MAAVLKAMDAERRDARVQTLSMEKNVAVETVLSVISPTLPQITSTSAMEVTKVIDKSPRAAFATRGRECTMYVRDVRIYQPKQAHAQRKRQKCKNNTIISSGLYSLLILFCLRVLILPRLGRSGAGWASRMASRVPPIRNIEYSTQYQTYCRAGRGFFHFETHV